MKCDYKKHKEDLKIVGASVAAQFDGPVNYKLWSEKMVSQFGDDIKPHLDDLWRSTSSFAKEQGLDLRKQPLDELVKADPLPNPPPSLRDFEDGINQASNASIVKDVVGKGRLLKAAEGLRRFIVDIPETILQDKARTAVMDRASEIQLREHNLGEFGKQMKSAFTEAERAEMPFYRERTKNPFTGEAPALSDAAKKFVDETIEPYLKKGFDELVEYGLLSEEQYVTDFLSHFWEGGGKGTGVSKLAMRVRQGRKIPTIAEGIELGLKPKFKDMWDYIKTYEEMRTRVIANVELVRKGRNITDGNGNPMYIPMTKRTRHLIDEGYVVKNNHALNRAVYVSRKTKSGKNVTVETYPPTLVHPDWVRATDRVFTDTFNPGWMQSIRTLNATAKASQLMFSLFHPFTLLESALGVGIEAPFKHKFGLELMKDAAFVEEMSKVGRVQLGIPHDVGSTIVRNAMLKLESKTSGIPLVNQASTLLRRYNDFYNQKLWDEYQTGLKAYAYWKLKAKMLEKNPDLSPRVVTERVGEFVNNAFGGQNWDAMLMNPHVQDVLHAALLAPDWTISNIKQGATFFKSSRTGALRAKMAGLPDDVVKRVAVNDMLDGQMGRAYWARTGTYSFLGLQMLNLIFTSMSEDGEARFTWENPGDHTLDFYVGKNDKGQELYASPQKQTKEVLRWITDLPHNLGSKASPFVRLAGEQLVSHDVGSGFPAPWAREDEFGIKPNFLESIPQRLLGAAETYVPFSFSGSNFAFTLPVSRGLTSYKFIQEYRRAYKDNNYGQMQRLELAARANNLKVNKLKQQARSKVKAGMKSDRDN